MAVKMIDPTPEQAKRWEQTEKEWWVEMEKKHITDKTPEKFHERMVALCDGDEGKCAGELGTEQQTYRRWITGRTRIPGVAWVALGALEASKAEQAKREKPASGVWWRCQGCAIETGFDPQLLELLSGCSVEETHPTCPSCCGSMERLKEVEG